MFLCCWTTSPADQPPNLEDQRISAGIFFPWRIAFTSAYEIALPVYILSCPPSLALSFIPLVLPPSKQSPRNASLVWPSRSLGLCNSPTTTWRRTLGRALQHLGFTFCSWSMYTVQDHQTLRQITCPYAYISNFHHWIAKTTPPLTLKYL
jgi:hypothetical protein